MAPSPPPDAAPPDASRGLRVATYNLLHGVHVCRGTVDLEAVVEAIAGLDADVVALQEVDRALDRSGAADQVGAIAATLGWHGAFAPALLGDPDRRWGEVPATDPGGPAYGVGLLSRRPLRAVDRLRLPGGGAGERRASATSPQRPGWDREPRVALAADVDAGGRTVRVVTTHLSYLPWRAVAQLRRAAVAAGPGPAVLLGDLNLPPGPVRLVLGRDWTAAGGGPTYPAWKPRARLDHVLVRGAALHDVRVGALLTSDHLPVSASVVLARP